MKRIAFCLGLLCYAGCYFPEIPASPATLQRQDACQRWEDENYRRETLRLERARLELERARRRREEGW